MDRGTWRATVHGVLKSQLKKRTEYTGHCPLVVAPGKAGTKVPPGDSFKRSQVVWARKRHSWVVFWYFALRFIIILSAIRE